MAIYQLSKEKRKKKGLVIDPHGLDKHIVSSSGLPLSLPSMVVNDVCCAQFGPCLLYSADICTVSGCFKMVNSTLKTFKILCYIAQIVFSLKVTTCSSFFLFHFFLPWKIFQMFFPLSNTTWHFALVLL